MVAARGGGEAMYSKVAEKLSNYRAGIRSASRGLWTGTFDYDQFFEVMMTTIQAGLTQGWYEGARECSIEPNELKPEERLALQAAISTESQYIDGLAQYIAEHSKANGGKLAAVFTRIEPWINRYNSVRNAAKVSACGDRKLVWRLGIAEHCSSCLKLEGKVKRGSQWQAAGIQPQNAPNPLLECQGYNCQCTLSPTDEPMSKGPFPRLP